jgi:hypothetical protein
MQVGGDITVTGSLDVAGDLNADGDVDINDTGLLHVDGFLAVGGDVTVDGTLDTDGGTSVGGQMTLNNTLDGNGDVEVTETLVINPQSTMTGSGNLVVPAAATMQWTGRGDISKNLLIFGGASFSNAIVNLGSGNGVTVQPPGNATFSGTSVVNASGAGGHLTIAGDAQVIGTVTTTHGSAPARFNVNSTGVVLVTTAGFLNLGSGGDISGPLTSEGSGNIAIAGVDPYNFGEGWSVTSEGQTTFGLTSVNVNAPGSVSGNVSINNTTINTAAAIKMGATPQRRDEPPPTTVNWLSGTFSGTGSVIVEAGTTLNITGTQPHNLACTMDLSGQANWTGGAFSMQTGDVLNVLDGGSFIADTAGTLTGTGGTAGGGMNVLAGGSFIKRGGGTVRFTRTSGPFFFNNSSPASVVVEVGTLALGGGGTHSGHFEIQTGATLQMEGPDLSTFAAGWSMSGNGAFAIVGGTHSFATGTIPATITASLGPNAILSGAGDLTVAGTFNWTGGEMIGTGKTIFPAGATLNLSGGSNKFVRRVVDLAGAGNWMAGNLVLIAGTFNVLAGGTFVADTAATLQATGGSGTNVFNNAGTFTKLGTGTVQLPLGSPISFSNTGIVNVDTGALSLQSGVAQHSGNTLSGGTWNVTGTLNFPGSATIRTNAGHVTLNGATSSFVHINSLTTNTGTFALAGGRDFTASPVGGTLSNNGGTINLGVGSVLSVNGAFSQPGSTLHVDIAGPVAGTDFGQLVATGAIALNGSLTATLLGGYDPGSTASFPVVVGALRSGTFSSFTGGPTPSNRSLSDRYDATSAYVAVGPLTASIPDMAQSSDSGVSGSDDNTNDTTPTFSGTAAEGSTARIYADGVLVGSAPIVAGAWSVTTSALLDGPRVITATVIDADGDESVQSTGLAVTIDTVGVAAPTSQFLFETGHSIRFTFGENVIATLANADVTVANLNGGGTVGTSLSYSNPTATWMFTGLPGGILPNGNYRATIAAANVTDLAGNPLLVDAVLDFFALTGDANHDRHVDVADLGILASNWQQSPRTFSQGDFSYDGIVDVADLGILASNWQRQLASPAPAARPARHPLNISRLVDGLL